MNLYTSAMVASSMAESQMYLHMEKTRYQRTTPVQDMTWIVISYMRPKRKTKNLLLSKSKVKVKQANFMSNT